MEIKVTEGWRAGLVDISVSINGAKIVEQLTNTECVKLAAGMIDGAAFYYCTRDEIVDMLLKHAPWIKESIINRLEE